MHLETAVALLPVVLRSTQRCLPEWIPGIRRPAGAVGPGATVIRGLRHFWGRHLNIPKSETTKKTNLVFGCCSVLEGLLHQGSGQDTGRRDLSHLSPVCAFPGTQRICWSRSHWDPFSSESVTVTWATHSPTSKVWAWGQGGSGLPWKGQGGLHITGFKSN